MSLETLAEAETCRLQFVRFVDRHCKILVGEGETAHWSPFRLWPSQRAMARKLQHNRLVLALKARQLGATWEAGVCLPLWCALFHPIATVLLFSRRDDEAVDLLSRIEGVYTHLPPFLQNEIVEKNTHRLQFANGSKITAFPTTAGDSYTATLAVVDEADLVPDLGKLMRAVKPTIDGGGRMVMISRSDKTKPGSVFKNLYTSDAEGKGPWHPIFLPWHAHPSRDQAWYDEQFASALAATKSVEGARDYMGEQYPATPAEALAPFTLNKRILPSWLTAVFQERSPLPLPPEAPSIPGLKVYRLPEPGHYYVAGSDPAEGNPTSDDSSTDFLDLATGEQVACLAGKLQPEVLAKYTCDLAHWYNRAALMVERNNHGHAVILWVRQNGMGIRLLDGHDDKTGWNSSALGKTLLYDAAADAVRNEEVTIHDLETFTQLASIEGSTLRAPEGEHDDRADSFALATAARLKSPGPFRRVEPSVDARLQAEKMHKVFSPNPVPRKW